MEGKANMITHKNFEFMLYLGIDNKTFNISNTQIDL
jgi:hypothetical protein